MPTLELVATVALFAATPLVSQLNRIAGGLFVFAMWLAYPLLYLGPSLINLFAVLGGLALGIVGCNLASLAAGGGSDA